MRSARWRTPLHPRMWQRVWRRATRLLNHVPCHVSVLLLRTCRILRRHVLLVMLLRMLRSWVLVPAATTTVLTRAIKCLGLLAPATTSARVILANCLPTSTTSTAAVAIMAHCLPTAAGATAAIARTRWALPMRPLPPTAELTWGAGLGRQVGLGPCSPAALLVGGLLLGGLRMGALPNRLVGRASCAATASATAATRSPRPTTAPLSVPAALLLPLVAVVRIMLLLLLLLMM